ncbi:MAG TPA: aminodeoxychorismate synthase component I [Solirubrobacteraceae bacterium]|nr:aminodeoxychorismate synthase component I [Solirubrobacteraceae bacterium]
MAKLIRVPLRSDRTPAEVLRALSRESMLVALLGEWAGSAALIGSNPICIANRDSDPFALLDRQPRVAYEANGAVGGGWFGYLGYQLGRELESLHPSPPRPRALPPFHLAFYDHVIRLDGDGQWWFEALSTERRAAALGERLAVVRRALAGRLFPRNPYRFTPWRSTPAQHGHAAVVEACQERITRGDIFQANLALRLHSDLEGDMLEVFCDGVARLESKKAAYISAPWGAIASFSPELFLSRCGDTVRTAPIKGTQAISKQSRAAERRRHVLEHSQKDRAENVMIVDLMRNDLGRVCDYGSVTVEVLVDARREAGVLNLVSEVTGRTRAGTTNAELLRATFPPGSVTGTPKVAAMNVIAELESTAREVYTGAIGFASPLAGLELNVAIRTVEASGKSAWLSVGGGIVADSVPEDEASEAMVKARPVLEAIGASVTDEKSLQRVARPKRHNSIPVPRPDPRCGVFETMLVAAGSVPHLEAHLARLASSVWALYGLTLPVGVRSDILRAAEGHKRARLRVVALPLPGYVDLEVKVKTCALAEEISPPVGVELAMLPGGLGRHKWRDRRLINAHAPRRADVLALFVDADGYVLEADRASVFAVRGKSIVTPPLDGRILPGTTRAHIIDLARRAGYKVEERPTHCSSMEDADEVFLTSALCRVESVTAIDGYPASPRPGVAVRLREIDNLTAAGGA